MDLKLVIDSVAEDKLHHVSVKQGELGVVDRQSRLSSCLDGDAVPFLAGRFRFDQEVQPCRQTKLSATFSGSGVGCSDVGNHIKLFKRRQLPLQHDLVLVVGVWSRVRCDGVYRRSEGTLLGSMTYSLVTKLNN